MEVKHFSFFRVRGGSGEVRASQIAEYLHAEVNPPTYEGVVIFVKMKPPADYPHGAYLDVVDAQERVSWLIRHPFMKAIACSLTGKAYLEKKLGREVTYIPQHHCNFERLERVPGTGQIGVVGHKTSITEAVKIALNVKVYDNYKTRWDVVKAYLNIDVQVIWRDWFLPLKSPLKIVNAASFGIPTVAYPNPAYREMEGFYHPVISVQEMVDCVRQLQTFGYDRERLIKKAEEYHIEQIAKYYEAL